MEYIIEIQLLVLMSGICEFVLCELVLRGPEDNCRLWTPPTFGNLKDNDRVGVGPLSSLIPGRPVQIGVYVQYTDWMRYEGCTLQLYGGTCTHRLSGQTDPIIECYEHCNKTTFSLFDGCCYCRAFSLFAKNTCTAKQCFSTYNRTCGESFGDRNSGCFCQYRPIKLSVRGGPSNCMAVSHKKDQNVRLQSINCKTKLLYFGARGPMSKEFPKASWWTAAERVQNDKYFFANETYLEKSVRLKGNTWYWVGIFRKRKLLPERPTGAEFCGMLIKGREGTVKFTIKECNDSLSKLCETNDTSPIEPQTTVLISGTKPVPTDSRPEVDNKPELDDKPEMDDESEASDRPEVDNKPEVGNNNINTGVIIAIVIGITLLIVVPIIVFVIRRRKVKISGIVMAANGSSGYPSAKRNVYTSPSGLGEHLYDGYSEVNIDDELAVYHEVNTDTDQGAQVDNYDSFVSAKNRTVQVSSDGDYGHVRGAVPADQGEQVDNYDSFVSAKNRTVQVSSDGDYGHVRSSVPADQGEQVDNYDSFVSAKNRTQDSSDGDYAHVRGAVPADQGEQVDNYDSFVSAKNRTQDSSDGDYGHVGGVVTADVYDV